DFAAAQLGQQFRINGAGIATRVTISCRRDTRGPLAIERTIDAGRMDPSGLSPQTRCARRQHQFVQKETRNRPERRAGQPPRRRGFALQPDT
ncbi:MAG TPA: hypothetical protein PKW88_13080, partial [Plasticicumulans sp.]|nr:hypothetical protein [Plasticicumulans sp.]